MSDSQTVQFPLSYVERLADCLKAHSINLDSTKPHTVSAAKNYLEKLSAELLTALENGSAGRSITPTGDLIHVDWCEANTAFAVTKNGLTVECFPTRAEADRYARELAKGVVHDEAAAAQA